MIVMPARSQRPEGVRFAMPFSIFGGYFKSATDVGAWTAICSDRYRFGQASKEDLTAKTRDLLDRHPNTYLQYSTLLRRRRP